MGIEIICPICQRKFQYCQHCWRGHKYCGPNCSLHGRRQNRRASEKKYAATDKGRESRRRRQKNFRNRNILNFRVTDHSPNKITPIVSCFTKSKKATNQCWDCHKPLQIVAGGRHEISIQFSEERNYFSFTRFRSKHNRLSL